MARNSAPSVFSNTVLVFVGVPELRVARVTDNLVQKGFNTGNLCQLRSPRSLLMMLSEHRSVHAVILDEEVASFASELESRGIPYAFLTKDRLNALQTLEGTEFHPTGVTEVETYIGLHTFLAALQKRLEEPETTDAAPTEQQEETDGRIAA